MGICLQGMDDKFVQRFRQYKELISKCSYRKYLIFFNIAVAGGKASLGDANAHAQLFGLGRRVRRSEPPVLFRPACVTDSILKNGASSVPWRVSSRFKQRSFPHQFKQIPITGPQPSRISIRDGPGPEFRNLNLVNKLTKPIKWWWGDGGLLAVQFIRDAS